MQKTHCDALSVSDLNNISDEDAELDDTPLQA